MAAEPRGYTRKEAQQARQKVSPGVKVTSVELDGTTTTEDIKLGTPAEQVSVQGTGTLAGTFEVSLNGTDFVAGGSIAVAAINNYSTSLVVAVRVNRTSGTGRAVVVARQ